MNFIVSKLLSANLYRSLSANDFQSSVTTWEFPVLTNSSKELLNSHSRVLNEHEMKELIRY